MDPPPLPVLPTATSAPTTTVNATAIQVNYPDSVDSSPRSRNADTACWLDEPLPPVPGAKLRFMCSFGGHIIPRPHDKSLCYVGGETRIVVVDRHSYLSDLSSRLSHTLLNGRPFTLKYQLPHEDLDSLISVSTDEDLENMIEEYDRTTSDTNLKPTSRLRLFLFFSKPETAASMGALLDDSKSETWFVDALNHAGLLPRRVSDSATGCILNLDQDLEAQAADSLSDNNKQVRSNVHDVHSMPDSMVENNSSYGSSSSSPSMSNLPPIRIRVEDQKVGMEEQFAQISLAPAGLKQDDTFGVLSAPPPPLPTVLASAITVASTGIPTAVSNETMNRVFSDDERSDQGVPVGFRKPPLPLQPVHMKAGGGGGNYSLHSPESVASDCSIASSNSVSKAVYYQEQVHAAHRDNRANNSPNTNNENPDSNSRTQQQQVQDSGYMYPPQMDQQQQQQFLHASSHYMQAPMSSYYQMYAPSSQQQQLHHPTDQQYAMYVMPSVAQQAQSYNMSMQSNIPDQTSPHPANVAASGAYKDAIPPIYPTKTTAPAKSEMASGIYGTAVASNQQFVQLPSMQFQQQYAGFHPSQSIAVASSATGNYGYEYTNHPNDHQVYYTHQAAPLPSQYQTMTAAAAMALSDPSKQLPTESLQQIRTAQPP